MSGIDQDKIDDLIVKCSNILSSIRSNSRNVGNSLRDINGCYDGKSLNSILSDFCNQTIDYENLLNLYQSYLDCLRSVRDSYVLQDISFSNQINKLNL